MQKDQVPTHDPSADMTELRDLLLQKGLISAWPYLSQFLPSLSGWCAAYDEPTTPDRAARELIDQLGGCIGRPSLGDLAEMITGCDFVHYRARAVTGEKWSPSDGPFLAFATDHPDCAVYFNPVEDRASTDKTFLITQRLQG